MEKLTWSSKLQGPYIVAGNRAYLIGDMDGSIPLRGEHIPGEMGGLWRHPNKLLQGIVPGWAYPAKNPVWPKAETFVRGPWFVEQTFLFDKNVRARRKMWVPDDQPGLMMELTLLNRGDTDVILDVFMAFIADLHPGWLDDGERGQDDVSVVDGHLVFENIARSWWVACLSEPPGDLILEGSSVFEEGPAGFKSAVTRHRMKVSRDEPTALAYWIVGKDTRPEPLSFPLHRAQWWAEKQARYRTIDAVSCIAVPDKTLMHAARWMKYQADWLIRSVPEIGTGLGAGVMEYPWWFACDNNYALKGVLSFGQHEWAQETLELLKNVSDQHNGNGRIVHELSTTGKIYNAGNAQEAPQFCDAVWETFLWTGDKTWLRAMYPAVEKAMSWVCESDPSGRDLAPGYGIIEIEDLNLRMIDTAVYTYLGLLAYANMARTFGKFVKARELEERAQKLKGRILSSYWIPSEGLFGDFLAWPEDVPSRAEKWSKRAASLGNWDAAAKYADLPAFKGHGGEYLYLMKNWIINTPLEAGLAPREWAKRALTRMRSDEFRGPYGLYLSGIERREIMTISTGVQAVAELRYENADEALQWMSDMVSTMDIRSPGTISEMSPDYGCFVQAWTAYGLWYPLITGFFGIRPHAALRRTEFNPHMPSQWKWAKVSRVRMGSNFLDCEFTNSPVPSYRISTREPWTIGLSPGYEAVNMHSAHGDHSEIHLDSPGSWVLLRKIPDGEKIGNST